MIEIKKEDVANNEDDSENIGTGSFDCWMRVFETHIEKQFQNKSLTGTEYAGLYLGSLQVVLNASVQFELNRRVSSKQEELIDAQIKETEETTKRNNALAEAEIALKKAQELDILYVTAHHRPQQTCKLIEEIDLLQSQDLTEIERAKTQAQLTLKTKEETDLLESQDQTEMERTRTQAEITTKTAEETDLIQSQDLTEMERTLTQVQITAKTAEEVKLLAQKTITEVAQTNDNSENSFGTGINDLTGTMGAQRDLQRRQAQAFIAKHHVDTVKTLADIHAVAYAITEGEAPAVPNALLDKTGNITTDLDQEITEMKAAMDVIT